MRTDHRYRVPWTCALAWSLLVACGPAPETAAPAPVPEAHEPSPFDRDVEPFLREWCAGCHGGDEPEAGLALDWVDAAGLGADSLLLREIRHRVRTGEMPPPDEPRAARGAAEPLLAWLTDAIRRAEAERPEEPGRVTLRRLSRVEYDNTIRDLLGVHMPVAAEFPAEDLGHGFDNIGDALSLSPLHLEKYVAAAERIAAAAVVELDPETPPAITLAATGMQRRADVANPRGDFLLLYTNGEVLTPLHAPRDGTYRLRAHAYQDAAGPAAAVLAFRVDGRTRGTVDVTAGGASPADYQLEVELAQGEHTVGFAFTNDFYDPGGGDRRRQDRNLAVKTFAVVGPVDACPPPASHRRIFAPDPGAAAGDERAPAILAPLASRAFRRPVTADELERLTDLARAVVADGATFETGIRLALTAILSSPHFLFRVENGVGEGAVRGLSGQELATRLSYFLWSSLPDDELSDLAASGRLAAPSVMASQVRRMLLDPRSSALAENFAAQWLELRNLDDVSPDPARFPQFDDGLRASMRRESELFFEAVLRERRSVRELLDADFSFLDERLAKHYGIEGVSGPRFRRVRLPDRRRGGLLTQAAILTVTSNPTRTSPVKRGKWLLDEILADPPPPPMPGVGSIDESAEAARSASLRERLEQHRSKPECATCHTRMDALGFALENYDPVGAWRERDGEFEVDASARLPDGREFSGVEGLRAVLLADDAFLRCLVKKLATYALGRGLEPFDEPAIDRVLERLPQEDPTLEDLILGIVEMAAFRKRRVEAD